MTSTPLGHKKCLDKWGAVHLTPEQRKDLRLAFRKQGYDINYYPCG